MTTEARLRVVPLAREHGASLSALFERAGSSCYCRYFHFAGDKHAWLERSALSPELNRRELLLAIEQDSLEARGLVALTPDDAIVGWMKLAPAAALAKLWTQRPYRGLSNVERESSDCYTIGCFLVDPNQRRRGVARALVQAAPAIARQWGARWLQAVPYRAAMAPAELIWTGPAELLRECGFREVGGVGPYPVLRLDL